MQAKCVSKILTVLHSQNRTWHCPNSIWRRQTSEIQKKKRKKKKKKRQGNLLDPRLKTISFTSWGAEITLSISLSSRVITGASNSKSSNTAAVWCIFLKLFTILYNSYI